MKRVWAPLALGLGAALGCGQPRKPVDLTVTPEAVVLIQDNEERCAKIAQSGVEAFRAAEAEERRAREAAVAEERLRLARTLARTEPPPTSDAAVGPPAASAEPPSAAERFQEFLKRDAAQDLAVVDRAGELAAQLLPKVGEEAPKATAQAVRDLLAAEQEVCRSSRVAADSSAELRKGTEAALHGYETAQTRLAARYAVSAVDAQFARHKYAPQLDEARAAARPAGSRIARMSPEQYEDERRQWAAQQDLQGRQQAEHQTAVHHWRARAADEPAAPLPKVGARSSPAKAEAPEALQQKMRTWHAAYAARAVPVRAALARYLGVRQRAGADVQPACRELLSATTEFLAAPSPLDAPDEAASQVLKQAYGELQELARACSVGLPAESTIRLARFERSIGNAAVALRPYAVKP